MAENKDVSTYNEIMRYPVLYDSAFDDDTEQGKVTLSDAVSCSVVFNWNAFPTLQMTYPRDGIGAKLLDYDKIIMTDISWKWVHQKFRISQIERDGDQYVINANHVAADLAYKPTMHDISIANANATDVFNQMINDLAGDDHEFQFTSNVSDLANVSIPAGVAGNILTDPDQEGDTATPSIIGLFGGELEFDNRTIYHSKQAGEANGVVINYGKNLQTITDDTNLDGVYTAIFPFAKYQPGNVKATATNVNWGNYETDYSSIGTVTYSARGDIDIYDTPLSGHHSIRQLHSGEHLQLGAAIHDKDMITDINGKQVEVDTMNGDDWYPIKGGGWIDGAWVNFDKTGDYLVNAAEGHVTVDGHGTSKESWSNRWHEHGYLIVSFKGKRKYIDEFYDPNPGKDHKPTGDKAYFGKQYHYDTVTVNSYGDTWYRLTDHRWVYGPHVSTVAEGASEVIPVSGRGYVKDGAQKYEWNKKKKTLVPKYTEGLVRKRNSRKRPYKPKKVKTTIPKGMKRIDKTMTVKGILYVHTSAGWIRSSSVDYKKAGSRKPTSPSKYIKEQASKTGRWGSKIEMYKDPMRKQDLNYSIPTGTPLDVTGEAKAADGSTMYQVTYDGKQGWIRADLTNTKGDSDLEPHSPDDVVDSDGDSVKNANIPEDQKEVEVNIGVVYSPETFTQENARIERVDLSSYFTHDDTDDSGLQPDGTYQATQADKDQLQRLAEDYIIEHNIGHPNTSITVDYEQLTGLAGDATRLNLYDYVDIEYDQMGIHVPAEVTSTTWDCLAHRYTQITIGDRPKSWQHLLLEGAQDKAEKTVSSSVQRTQGWLNRFEAMMKMEGSDRIRAENKMMDELGDIRHDVTYTDPKTGKKQTIKDVFLQSREDFEEHFQELDDDASDIKGWIDSPGKSVIKAYPNWREPDYLTAVAGNDAIMKFSANGLEFFDPKSNKLLGGFSSLGKLYSDSIEGVKVKAMEIDALTMYGSLISKDKNKLVDIYIGTQNPGSVLNPLYGGKVIWEVANGDHDYQSMMSAGQLAVYGHGKYTRIHPTEVTVNDDMNQVLTQENFAAHAYYRIKSWVKLWIADYLTINGKKRNIWLGKDKGANRGKLRNLKGQGKTDYSYTPGSNDEYGSDDSLSISVNGVDFTIDAATMEQLNNMASQLDGLSAQVSQNGSQITLVDSNLQDAINQAMTKLRKDIATGKI